jgi:hypothetical protein
MGGNLPAGFGGDKRAGSGRAAIARVAITLAVGLGLAAFAPTAAALGERFEVRTVSYGADNPRPTAPQRFAWEVRKRTSIDVELAPGSSRLDDADLFEHPFLYWAGDRAFDALSEGEIVGLRRFVRFGGFVLIDDNAPEQSGFDASIRRELGRAFGPSRLRTLPRAHTVFRSFYLLTRAEGRVRGPEEIEAVQIGDRVAVLYTRNDLGGALERDNLGSWTHPVVPGGEEQRERAIRFAVNVVMYALCLDYKDDQVHAPFIMRRRGPGP